MLFSAIFASEIYRTENFDSSYRVRNEGILIKSKSNVEIKIGELDLV